jgi:hypothetical protein
MPKLVIYENPTSLAFDNSPEYGNPRTSWIPDEVDFDNGTIIDTGSLYRSTVNYGGNTYGLAFTYSSYYQKIYSLAYSYNGSTFLEATDLSLAINTLLFYEGDVLQEKIFERGDLIVGSSKNETIWGYGGNDAIYGGGGNDSINGGYGLDYIDGGSGVDTAIYFYSSGNYAPSVNSSGDIEIIFYSGGSEFLTSIEYLSFSDGIMPTSQFGYVGSYSELSANSVSSVHRFYNTRDKAFFYTNSLAEANMVVDNSEPDSATNWPYIYQGSTFEAAHSYLSTTPLFRFYNTSTGHHFFTTSTAEKDLVITNSESGLWPFNYEGVAMQVYASDPTSFVGEEVAVHRFYNPTLNRHFFTGDETEVAEIKLTGDWNYEGIGFWGEVV